MDELNFNHKRRIRSNGVRILANISYKNYDNLSRMFIRLEFSIGLYPWIF